MDTLTLKLEPGVKDQAEGLFADMGLDLSTAIMLFLNTSLQMRGLPFAVQRPAEATDGTLPRTVQPGKRKRCTTRVFHGTPLAGEECRTGALLAMGEAEDYK